MKQRYFLIFGFALFISLVLNLTLTFMPLSSFVSAESSFGLPSGMTGGACPVTERFKRWGDFVQHGLSFDDWTQNWKDIFNRNACQREDIVVLQKRLEKTRTQIRQRIFSCNYKALDSLINLEVRLQIELDYIRRIVESDEERSTGNPDETVLRNRTRVYQEMYSDIVNDRKLVDEVQFNTFFLQIEQKYSDRLSSYTSCENPTWEELSQKWNSFVDSAAGVKPAWDRLETTVSNKWEKVKKSPSQRAGNYLGGFLDIKLNGLDPQKTLTDITQELAEVSPGGLPTYFDVLDRFEVESQRYAAEDEKVRRFARYEALYRHSSDDVVGALGSKLVELNKIIKGTFPVMENLRSCVSSVAAKQCGS